MELNVISKAVKLRFMTADDLTQGEHTQDEEEGAEN